MATLDPTKLDTAVVDTSTGVTPTPTNIPAVTPEEQARLDRLNLYGTNKDMYTAEINRINNALATGIGADGKPLNQKAAADWLARVQTAGSVWNAPANDTGIPSIADYINPNQGKMDTLYGQLESRGPFTDTMATNESFQAMLGSMTEQGQRAARNTVGTMLGNTGWQTNTAVAAAAQQVAENAISDAMSMYPAYRQQAYSEYAGETKRLMDLYGILVDADETTYSRYVDMINQKTDEQKQAIMQKQQDYENKQTELANQYDRINEMGYVDNAASLATGIPVGTRSREAQSAIDDQNFKLEQDRIRNEYDLQQIQAQQSKEISVINAAGKAKTGGADVSKLGTPEQVENYNTLYDIYMGGGYGKWAGNAYGAREWLKSHKSENVALMGNDLYNRLISDLSAEVQYQDKYAPEAEAEPIPGEMPTHLRPYTQRIDNMQEATMPYYDEKSETETTKSKYTDADIIKYIDGLSVSADEKDLLADYAGLPK